MIKYLFPPEAFPTPYVTVPISELVQAIAAKRLGRSLPVPVKSRAMDPISGRVVGTRRTDRDAAIAKAASSQQVLLDLRSRSLIAHVHSEATGQFRRITADFWSEPFAGLALSNTIFDIEDGPRRTFPPELDRSTVYILGDNAISWLGSQGIAEEDAFFPDCLRSQPKALQRRRPQYDWPAFEKEAVSRLHDEGAFSGEWRQARLEEQMFLWCQKNWGKEPSHRIVRDHVKAAARQFMREKKMGFGSLGK